MIAFALKNRLFIVAAGAGLLLAGSAAAQRPAAPPRRAPSRVVLPPGAPPVISLEGLTPETRRAQGRLALFITALQQRRRVKAASLLSRRVTPRERRALLEGRWLARSARGSKSFSQILYWPDLQIRTHSVTNGVPTLYVVPRIVTTRKKGPAGYLVVRMRQEEGDWFVEMHP